YGDTERFLRFDRHEHPIALQLGGSNPKDLAACAQLAESHGYDEVNLNCGCPSDRVQNGSFGACLMQEPELVANCVRAMQSVCNIPVTVKCRIGIDDQDEETALQIFAEHLVDAGCRSLTVHARKAWLQGLSPKENRDIPPLNYERVYRLKQDFTDLEIVINGGIQDMQQIRNHLQFVDGVMIGREAYHNPWLLARIDSEIFGEKPNFRSPVDALEAMYPYIESQLAEGERLASITRHILGLFQGIPGTRRFKQYLSENAHKPGAGLDVLINASSHFQNNIEMAAS
ncbi:MAG: tRNA dihydrouridine(20/20a) synthase DusA, partial [Gammaproteobacteria bacterium]